MKVAVDLTEQPVVLALLQHEELVKIGKLYMRKRHKVGAKHFKNNQFSNGRLVTPQRKYVSKTFYLAGNKSLLLQVDFISEQEHLKLGIK